MDVASLGIAIDSKQAKTASVNLVELQKASGKAEIATEKLTDASQKNVSAMLASARASAANANADLRLAASSKAVTTSLLSETRAAEKLGVARSALGGAGGFLRGLASGAAGALSLTLLADAAQKTIKSIADIGDEAQKLGLATGEYQQMAFAAQLAGVETESLSQFMKVLGRNTSDAARGQGSFNKLLQDNGISLRDSNGQLKSQAEVLKIVADLIKNAANEQDALKIASIAGGRGGAESMNLLKLGAEGVEKALREAKEEGVQFSEEQIARAQIFDDKLDTLIKKISVGLKGAFIDVAPYITNFFDATIKEVNALSDAFDRFSKFGSYMLGGQVSNAGKVDLPQSNSSSPLKGVSTQGKTTKIRNEDTFKESERLAKAAQREAAARSKAIQDVVKSLAFEGEQLKRTEREQEVYNQLNRAGVSINTELGQKIAMQARANFDATESIKAAKDAQNEKNRADKEAVKLALEQTNKIQIADLTRQAELDARTFSRGFSDSFSEYMQEAADYASYAKNLVGTFTSGLEGAFSRFAETGKFSFKDLTRSILADLGKISSKMAVSGLLGTLTKGILGASEHPLYGGGGGGFLSNLFAGFFAKGGTIGAGKFGVAGEGGGMRHAEIVTGPATVTPMSKLNGYSKPVLNLTVINNAPVEVSAKRDSSGGISINIDEIISRTIGSGKADKAMARYGLSPSRVIR